MKLFDKPMTRRAGEDLARRLAALEDYVEYLRRQGEYGADQTERRLTALEGGKERA